MKEIICICGAGLITILAASGLKKNSPGISILIAVSGGILIIVAVLPRLTVLYFSFSKNNSYLYSWKIHR